MAKNDPKRGLDEQLLEGGGGGGGRYKSSPRKSYDPDAEAEKIIGVGFGAPLAAAGTMAAIGKADRTMTEAGDEQRDKERREAKNEMKRETRGMAKGGSASARADGCATKGKTKGRFV
jgi:hypothetical protein